MPGSARYILKWSVNHHSYELYDTTISLQHPLDESTTTWFHWLALQTSFAFEGRAGHLTLLKTTLGFDDSISQVCMLDGIQLVRMQTLVNGEKKTA